MMVRKLFQSFSRLRTGTEGRSMRRLLIGTYLATLCIMLLSVLVDLMPRHDTTRLYGLAALICMLNAMGFSVFWLRFIRRTSVTISFDDQARVDFGRPYEELSAMHQFDVRVRVKRQGGRPPDERDAVLQREAEQISLRILRIALPVLSFSFWIVSLCLSPSGLRSGMLIGAVALSVAVIPVLILPDVIRLWTEPDAAAEPSLVAFEGEA